MIRIGLFKHPDDLPGVDTFDDADAATQAVIRALHACGRQAPCDPDFTSRLRARLTSGEADAEVRGSWARWSLRQRSLRTRLVSSIAVLLLGLGALGGYLRLNTPTPVSAQDVLRRAVAALPAASPGQVIHQISSVSTVLTLNRQTPRAVTVDQWAQLNGSGALIERAATISDTAGRLNARLVDLNGTESIYDPQNHYIDVTPDVAQPGSSWVQDPFGIAQMRRLVQSAQTSKDQNLHLLSPQTIDGGAVYVVQVDNAVPLGAGTAGSTTEQRLTLTVYVDMQTYAIRGLDLNEVDGAVSTPVVTMRVQQFDVVPLSSVPASTFALDAPARTPVSTAPAPNSAVEKAYQQSIMTDTVTGAVAMPDQPALLLPGSIDGLRSRGAMVTRETANGLPYTSTGYSYGEPLQGPDEMVTGPDGSLIERPSARSVTIGVSHATPGPNGQVPGEFSVVGQRPITVTVDGRVVQAQYWDREAPMEVLHSLVYRQGNSWVMLGSHGLSTTEFFAMVGALVDAHAHPEVVAEAQREADIYQYEIDVAGMATFGSAPGLQPTNGSAGT